MMTLRCGRLDRHAPHDWFVPRAPFQPSRIYRCEGHVITEGAMRAEDAAADKAEDEDSRLREALRDWGRS